MKKWLARQYMTLMSLALPIVSSHHLCDLQGLHLVWSVHIWLDDLSTESLPWLCWLGWLIHIWKYQMWTNSGEKFACSVYYANGCKPYCEAIGTLNWAALTTCPDIAFAVATISRFTANPGITHWEAVKQIYHYLAGMRNLWLTYGETKQALKGYADTDGSMAKDRHAMMSYAFLIDGGAMSWSSKQQEIVSLSTTKSKCIAATHGMKEVLWLRSLLSKVFGPIKPPTTLFSQTTRAIALTWDNQYHAHTKHINVRYHFIQWVIEQGSLHLIYCLTDDMVANTLTKALPSAKVKNFTAGLGLHVKWGGVSDVSMEQQWSTRQRLGVPWYGMPETSTVSSWTVL